MPWAPRTGHVGVSPSTWLWGAWRRAVRRASVGRGSVPLLAEGPAGGPFVARGRCGREAGSGPLPDEEPARAAVLNAQAVRRRGWAPPAGRTAGWAGRSWGAGG